MSHKKTYSKIAELVENLFESPDPWSTVDTTKCNMVSIFIKSLTKKLGEDTEEADRADRVVDYMESAHFLALCRSIDDYCGDTLQVAHRARGSTRLLRYEEAG